jgi:hypothetical protein
MRIVLKRPVHNEQPSPYSMYLQIQHQTNQFFNSSLNFALKMIERALMGKKKFLFADSHCFPSCESPHRV